MQPPLGRSDGQLAALARDSGRLLAPVLQKDEARLLGDPGLSVAVIALGVVVGGHVIGIHRQTAFSATSPSNVPRRDAPIVWPRTWWYGTPVKRWWLFVGMSSPRVFSGASPADTASVRAMTTKSPRPRSSATARAMRSLPTISSAEMSALPAICPQRLGSTWSSMCAPATPAFT